MKVVKVTNEKWFRNAPFGDVKMLGIKCLGVPADRFMSTQSEQFKRALVRQMFIKKFQYGHEFEMEEISNPFGVPKRKRSRVSPVPSGEYRFVKNRLRCPKEDIRWEMMAVLQEKTTFEEAIAEFDGKYGKSLKFKSSGKSSFDFIGMINWALKSGWIEKEICDGT